mgnify:FL=1|tara:strand:- start:5670 stop:6401 length:732 start_codon:yes stop_codon:yes gene_type:complete
MSLGLGITNELLEYPTDWTPKDEIIGTKIALWLQNNVDIAEDGSAWLDSSGNGVDATQTTEANRPNVSSGGLNFDQSLPGIGNQFMDLDSRIVVEEGGAFSLFVVLRLDDTRNEAILSDSNNEFVEILSPSSLRFKANNPSNVTTVLRFDTSVFTTNPMIVSLLRDADGAFQVFVDGTAVVPNSSSTNTENDHGFDFQNIGSRNDNDRFLDGVIFELLFYTDIFTGNQLTRMHAYLKEKFNIS